VRHVHRHSDFVATSREMVGLPLKVKMEMPSGLCGRGAPLGRAIRCRRRFIRRNRGALDRTHVLLVSSWMP
jgi:hypothetical protein